MENRLIVSRSSKEDLGVVVEGCVDEKLISNLYYAKDSTILRRNNSLGPLQQSYETGTGVCVTGDLPKAEVHEFVHSYAVSRARVLLGGETGLVDKFYDNPTSLRFALCGASESE